jgi:hypothetical protein
MRCHCGARCARRWISATRSATRPIAAIAVTAVTESSSVSSLAEAAAAAAVVVVVDWPPAYMS